MSDEAQTAIAHTRHWLMQAVIGLNLCPFAKAVVVKDMVRYQVSLTSDPEAALASLDAELQYLAAADPQVLDTTLLILPHLYPVFLDFNDFLADCDALLHERGLQGVLQIADFHPHYQFAGEAPEDMSHYTNRAPYPTLHLLRESSLDQAVASFPDAAEIFERNMARLRALGPEGWAALGIRSPGGTMAP